MSQYHRIPDTADELPLYHYPPLKQPTDDEATYPPRAVPSGVSAPVEYIFVPRYPTQGSKESALGVMGKDREETTALVQDAFPKLTEYPPERFEFLVTATNAEVTQEDGWSRILDSAWPRMQHHPPARLKIQISDGPGDEERRNNRSARCFIMFVVILLLCFGGFVGLLISTSPKHKTKD